MENRKPRVISDIKLQECEPASPSTSDIETLRIEVAALRAENSWLKDQTETAFKSSKRNNAELTRANEALKWTTDRLAREPQLESYLGNILVEACEKVGAATGLLALYEPNYGTFRNISVVEDGQMVERFSETEMSDRQVFFAELIRDRRPRIFSVAEDWQLFPTSIGEYNLRRGHTTWLAIPLIVGGEALGLAGLATSGSDRLTEEEIEFFEAFAKQLALAIQLNRLTEEAKRSALTRERELVAQERAAELDRTNAAILQVFEALAADAGLERVLERILRAIAGLLESEYATLWVIDSMNELVHLRAVFDHGCLLSAPASGHPGARVPVSCDDPHFVRAMEQLRHGPMLIDAADELTLTEEQRVTSRNGLIRLLRIGMRVGDQMLGEVTVQIAGGDAPPPQRVAVSRGLTQQAALAVFMDRLGEVGRHAAIAEERNRMAHEIHDTLAQCFTGIFMQLQAAGEFALSKPEVTQACVERAESLARDGLREARRSVTAVRPDASEYSDIASALRRLVLQATAATATRSEVILEGDEYHLEPECGFNLLRIAQEALGNAQRYASAKYIQIRVVYGREGVCLVVADDGQGFDPSSVISKTGYGLIGMRQRAERLNGKLEINSAPGLGTEVRAWVPEARVGGRRQ
jgi:signal transduction histidine kinase